MIENKSFNSVTVNFMNIIYGVFVILLSLFAENRTVSGSLVVVGCIISFIGMFLAILKSILLFV